jgi:hypothetical protein
MCVLRLLIDVLHSDDELDWSHARRALPSMNDYIGILTPYLSASSNPSPPDAVRFENSRAASQQQQQQQQLS